MSDLNQVAISGRLTRDPEARGGGDVAQLSLASNRQYQRNGSWVEEVVYVRVSCFGHIAKKAIDKLIKGAPVTVSGRLELNQWQNEAGDKRSEIRIVASQLLSPAFQSRPNPAATEDLPTSANVDTETGEVKDEEAALVASNGQPVEDDDIPF